MNNYEELIEFRNKIVNANPFTIYEEDCQLLDRVLDDYENKDQQISQLKAENERLEKEIDRVDDEYLARIKQYSKDHDKIVKKIHQQLAEKDAEIERLNKQIDNLVNVTGHSYRTQIVELKTQLSHNTHQLCEKIRDNCVVTMKEDRAYYIVSKRFLDQLENNTEGEK